MGKDDATWLNICYILFGIVTGYVSLRAFETVGSQFGWIEQYDEWYPIVSTVCAILIGFGSSYWLKAKEERRDYHLSAISELQKVTWPSHNDTKRLTLVVVIVVAIFSVILSAFDLIWAKALQAILP